MQTTEEDHVKFEIALVIESNEIERIEHFTLNWICFSLIENWILVLICGTFISWNLHLFKSSQYSSFKFSGSQVLKRRNLSTRQLIKFLFNVWRFCLRKVELFSWGWKKFEILPLVHMITSYEAINRGS